MGKFGWIVVLLGGLGTVMGADGPSPIPADFKIRVGEFALKEEAVATAEIIVRQGRAYVFASDSNEVIIVEPARRRVGMIDIGRKVQSEITFEELELALEKLKSSLAEAADATEKRGSKGDRVEAAMARDLFQTRLARAEGRSPHQVRLSNASVEVVAEGQPEADPLRLASATVTLSALARLGAYRVPGDLPPFAELEAIAALGGDRQLMPTRLTYLYRLAGPPRRFHRTYQVVPQLTDREVEAVSRIDRLREVTPNLRPGRYKAGR